MNHLVWSYDMPCIFVRYLRLVLALFLCILPHNVCARQLITGDPNQTRDGKTFSFPVKVHYSNSDQRLYAFATKAGAKEFSISYLDDGRNEFKPYVTPKIKNGTTLKDDNPLYNVTIEHLAQLDALSIASVLQEQPQNLYILNSGLPHEIFSVTPVLDANGNATNGIVTLAGKEGTAFIAVKGNAQSHFGCGGSGIATVTFNQETKEIEISDKEIEEMTKKLKGKSEEEIQQAIQHIQVDKEGKKKKKIILKTVAQNGFATPLSCSSDCLKIKSDLVSISDTITMHWSRSLERLYIGLQVTGGPDANDGACGLLVGHFDANNTLILRPILNTALLTSQTEHIVAGVGSNTSICVHKLATMQTTTGLLDYLIVQGGSGTPDQTKRTIYALPLLNGKNKKGIIANNDIPLHGTLASVAATPYEAFSPTDKVHLFLGRHFVTPATSAHDLYTASCIAAQVGAGPCVDPIDDMVVKDDAVYAFVCNSNQDYAGVYHSQAIFDGDGRIGGWTAWRKIINDPQMCGIVVDSKQSNNLILSGNDDTITTVERTQWQTDKTNNNELIKTINQQFNKETGGISALINFARLTPGLGGYPMWCLLGLNTCVLVQPQQCSDSSIRLFENGIVDQALSPDTNLISFSNDVLKELGPLSCAEIACNESHSWLCIGGLNGLAVACNDDGSGLEKIAGFGKGFCQLRHGMRFKKIGDYQFVTKLIADGHYLYVLTDHSLDRITLTHSNFVNEQIHSTRLADISGLTNSTYGIFYDMIISEKFALLAHSNGLSRIGNGKDIQSDNHETLNWTSVIIPDACGPAISLIPVSVNARGCDVARFACGQIYVISGSISNNTARLHRFVLHGGKDCTITDDTLQPVHDFVVPDRISYFSTLSAYSSLFATNGSLFLTALDRKKTKSPLVVSGVGISKTRIPLPLEDASCITSILCNEGDGKWLIAGDFGLLINE